MGDGVGRANNGITKATVLSEAAMVSEVIVATMSSINGTKDGTDRGSKHYL
jgi:hypothetical protein